MGKIFYIVLFITIVALFMVFFGKKERFAMANSPTSQVVNSITATELQQAMVSKTGFIILDVREESEYKEGHISGAINIPLADLGKRSGELSQDKTIIVMCRSGMRSLSGYEILDKKGFKNIKNLTGGILAWKGSVEK